MSTISYSDLDYKRPSGVYVFPRWAIAVGWTIAVIPLIWLPIYAIYQAVRITRRGQVRALTKECQICLFIEATCRKFTTYMYHAHMRH